MEQPKEETRSLSDLLRMLADQKKGEALYQSFMDTMEAEIKTPEVRHDLVVNVVKLHATIEAARKAKITPATPDSEATTREFADAFEIECKLLCEDIGKLPERFRQRMTRPADGFDLLAVILGSCDCENCRRHREGSRKEKAEASETPTEPPPPPETGTEAPLG